jgi:hypothetical protein
VDLRQVLELLSYGVTIVGFPYAIAVYLFAQRKARLHEEEQVYLTLIDEYVNFLQLVLANADLHLRTAQPVAHLSEEQQERKLVLFDILVSLFERAYILVYDEPMSRQKQRLWHSWEDYMREWCRRDDFRASLPQLLQGEDGDFVQHISAIAQQEAASVPPE